jgi:hypothetical protein
MGGAYFEVGNITPAAEFNIYVDPEAAEIVFRSGVPITVMPLDVTHKALTTRRGSRRFARCPAASGRRLPAGPTSSSASTRRNTARRGRRCTIPAPSPGCCARPVLGARHQCRDRDRGAADAGHDGGGLLAGHRPAGERDLPARHRRGRVLRAADGATRAALSRATFFRGGIRRFLPVDKITGCGSMRENQETQQTRQPEVAP